MRKIAEVLDARYEKIMKAQLKALKADFHYEDMEDRVFKALVKIAKGAKQPPTLPKIYEAMAIPETTVRSVLRRLWHRGRVLHPSRGIWVPIVRRLK